MTPSIVWGLGVGLVIALADAVTIYLTARPTPPELPLAEINIMINVALYTLAGFRVGKATGIVRAAAESAVLAAFVVSAIGVAFLMLLRPEIGSIQSTTDVVAILAQNVALGGLIGIVAGWIGSRVAEAGANSRF